MIKPNDITQEIWDNLPEELQFAFSRNVNRSFITPMAEKTHEELRRCAVMNYKINSAGNQLRALAIDNIKDGDLEEVANMVESRHAMLQAGAQIQTEIAELQESLQVLKNAILQRIKFYQSR
jgi:hypothetical protein